MKSLELIEVGNEIAIIFPEELCASLQVGLGDDVHLTPTAHGFSLYSDQSKNEIFFQKTPSSTSNSQDHSA